MDEKTKAALVGSIEHWKRIVNRTPGETIGAPSCDLCQMFLLRVRGTNCEGCPVAEASGRPGCGNTPYVAASDSLELDVSRGVKCMSMISDRSVELARKELAFLESLLKD